MGMKLSQIFEFAKQAGGIQAQMRLAMKTGLTTEKAKGEPDSPELLNKIKAAVKEITGKEAPVA